MDQHIQTPGKGFLYTDMLLAYNNVQLAALRMNVLIIHVAEKKHSPVAPDSSGLQLQFLLCQISLWSEKNSKKNYEYHE